MKSVPPKNFWSQWIGVVVFAIAFAWVESALVVYLRDIFFDGDFKFPLFVQWEGDKHIVSPLIRIEFFREIATLIMLVTVGWLAGVDRATQFAFFMIAFGVWDIFYYVWLKVMVQWPASLMTWDLLFYVPLPWVGPVITPVLIALALVLFGTWLIRNHHQRIKTHWHLRDLVVGTTGCLLLIVAFCWDWRNILQIPGDPARTGIPNPFAWWLYGPTLCVVVLYFTLRFIQKVK